MLLIVLLVYREADTNRQEDKRINTLSSVTSKVKLPTEEDESPKKSTYFKKVSLESCHAKSFLFV